MSFAKNPGLLGLLGSTALLLGGCHHEYLVVPADTDDYYPVVVNTYRSYAVVDSAWTNGALTVSQYQFRERVSEQFTDATGQPAFRIIRSKRLNSAATWTDDSVFVIQKTAKLVLLTRNNVRSVELVYPVRAGKAWNRTAFTVNTDNIGVADTINNLTRAYFPTVGGAYTTSASGSAPAKTYDVTAATKNILPSGSEDLNVLQQRGTRQVYARGVGPVLRRRFSYYTNIYSPSTGTVITPGIVQNGASRRETLLESGTL